MIQKNKWGKAKERRSVPPLGRTIQTCHECRAQDKKICFLFDKLIFFSLIFGFGQRNMGVKQEAVTMRMVLPEPMGLHGCSTLGGPVHECL